MRIPQLYKGRVPRLFAAFCEGVEKLSLPRPLKDELTAFGRTLGSVSMSEQFAALDRAQAVLSEKEGEMKAESERKGRATVRSAHLPARWWRSYCTDRQKAEKSKERQQT